jgi:hypothetical protein
MRPAQMGERYAAWQDYESHLEDVRSPTVPPPVPAFSSDALRRRHRIGAPVAANDFRISPILTYFYLTVGVRNQNASAPFQVSLRWATAYGIPTPVPLFRKTSF